MRKTLFLVALMLGCGNSTEPTSGPSTGVTTSPAGSVVATVAAPASLKRLVTPAERRARDEKACEGNDAAACRKMADRYRGYGHSAGCGVDRARRKPTRMVTGADAKADARAFDKWLRRACDLGDGEACVQAKNNVASSSISDHDLDVCARSRAEDCPLVLWQNGMHPENEKKLLAKRASFIKSGVTAGIFGELYRKEKKPGGDTLPPEVATLADRICKSTLECDDVTMMLDKNGYTSAALAPYRKTAADTLIAACLAGECVCGEAIHYLDPNDTRRSDLARVGCDAGEPDACYELGRASEETDMNNAIALYDVACPRLSAGDGREEVLSKEACDRIAELHEEGKVLDKDSDRAFFYSTLACGRGGFERNHAPCLRRAMYHARGYKGELRWSIQTSQDIARDFFYGRNGLDGPDECTRPSVAPLCKQQEDAFKKALVSQ